jgi:uncharacterized protein
MLRAPSIGKRARPGFPGTKLTVGAVLLAAGFLLFATQVCAQILQTKPQGYVDDFAGVLSQSARDQLTLLCTEVDQKAHAQIAVVTVKSLDGRPIEDYSIDLATKWGIGPKQSASGILILFAIDDHKNRIEVGYGLESILPDGKTGSFLREAVPLLRAGNYDGALLLITRRVADVIAQDRGVTLTSLQSVPRSPPPRRNSGNDAGSGVIAIFIVIFLIFLIYNLAKAGGGGRRGGGGWWIGPMMGGGFGGGGFGGGGSGGGGGFGGFGGGSFGGGGASGSW